MDNLFLEDSGDSSQLHISIVMPTEVISRDCWLAAVFFFCIGKDGRMYSSLEC